MLGLFISLVVLGLSAIDPIGIAAMPILLAHRNPYRRSFTFLLGSFTSITLMGILFAQGFGEIIINFEQSKTWLVAYVEAIAGLILIVTSGILLWRHRKSKFVIEPSERMAKQLQKNGWRLFVLGLLVVTIQSIVDVVFVVAMLRVGQRHLRIVDLVGAIVTYSVAALAIQFAVIVAYRLSPKSHRVRTLESIQTLLLKYANQVLVTVSFILGCVLLLIAA